MFHFQTVFAVNWVESDHLEIKPQRPTSISNTEVGFLSEILSTSIGLTHLVLDFKYCKAVTDAGFLEIKHALEKMSNLKKLNLNFTECEKMSDTTVENIMEAVIKNNSLEELHFILEGCMNISSVGLYAVIDGLKHLARLSLLELTISGISDPLIENLTQTITSLSKLKGLILRFGAHHAKHGSLTDKGLKVLSQALESVQELEHFSIDIYRGDWDISDEGILRLRNALQKLNKLHTLHLNLRGIENVSQAGIGHLNEALTQLVNLQKLHLNFKSGNEASTIQLKIPLSVLHNLTHLHLDFSWGVSDNTIAEIKKSFLNLKDLNHLYINFSGCKDLTDAGVNNLKEILMGLPKLTNLHLEFPWCYYVTDRGFQSLAEGIYSLKELVSLALNFERGGKEEDGVTDIGINAIINTLDAFTNLKVLNLNFSNCITLTDYALISLKNKLPLLSHLTNLTLDFRLCEQITDEGVNNIKYVLEATSCINKILLNFMWCDKISDGCISGLLKLRKLKQFSQLLVAFKKNEAPEDEGGCQMF